MEIKNINISDLTISIHNNVRTIQTDNDIDTLSKNIETYGLINPITVVYDDDTKKYNIIAGQRRFKALNKLKWTNIPCNISKNLNDEKQKIISLTENIKRKDMTYYDKIKIISKLCKTYENNYDVVAQLINMNKRQVKIYHDINVLPDEIIKMIDNKKTEQVSLDYLYNLAIISPYKPLSVEEYIDIHNYLKELNAKYKKKYTKIINNNIKKHNHKPSPVPPSLIEIEVLNTLKTIQKEEKIRRNTEIVTVKYNNILDKDGKHLIKYKKIIDKIREDEISHWIDNNNIDKPIKLNRKDIIKRINISIKNLRKHPNVDDVQYINDMQENIHNLIHNGTPLYIETKKRNPILQNKYRDGLIKRYKVCILSDSIPDICEACHIKPLTESKNFDIDNGLLLDCRLHKLFDKHCWSINPKTLQVEIKKNMDPCYHNILREYNHKKINIDNYKKTINYLENHYNIFKSKDI